MLLLLLPLHVSLIDGKRGGISLAQLVSLLFSLSLHNLTMRLAAVEGGGTTWVAVIAVDTPHNIVERETFITELPGPTLSKIKEWLSARSFDAIGVATFGPVDAVPSSPTYGFITSTPKPNWKDTDVLTGLGVREFGKPFLFDTDVNAPAFAEFLLLKETKDPNLSSCAYITVGTGVGVGLVVNGGTVHGLMHPEAGHIRGREE